MKKRIISLILIVGILSTVLSAFPAITFAATSGICGENLTWTLDDSGTLTISGTGAMDDYEPFGWPRWYAPWYMHRETIKNVVFKSGITSIGNYAFYECSSLTSITIPDGVTSIGNNAFIECRSLTTVTIPDSVTSIGDRAFWSCNSLTNITIPDSVTSIGNEAFYDCNLTSITIPDSVLYIGDGAFCLSNLYDVKLGKNVKTIGKEAFRNCRIKNIMIPESVSAIGDASFMYCQYIENIEVAENNNYFSSINGNLFNKNCTKIIQYAEGKPDIGYTIPNGVKNVGNFAFSGCNLKSIVLPNSVTNIGNNAFCDCYSLEKVTMSSNLTSIGDGAFGWCWSLTSIKIPDSVQYIGENAFSLCKLLTSISIPDGITTLEDFTFAYSGLANIIIPESVKSIGVYTFSGCDKLTDVYYSGTKTDWNAISIGSGNDALINATIHCNYDNLKPNTNVDIAVKPKPDYIPETINEVTINGRGTAYGRFKILNTNGSAAKNATVSYSCNGGDKETGKTDGSGYITVKISDITSSGNYTYEFSGKGIKSSIGTLDVTVEPLHFETGFEAQITLGGEVGAGIGVGGSIGKLEAEAKIGDIGASGSVKRSFEFSQIYENNKNKISLTSKQNLDGAIKAKLGLFAEAGDKDFLGAKVSLGEISGSVSGGSVIGMSYEDDNFDINNSDDIKNAALFTIAAALDSISSNVIVRYVLEKINVPVNSYETGSSFSLGAGASIGEIKVENGDKEAGVTLAGINASSVWSSSTKKLKDNSKIKSASVKTKAGTELLNVGVKFSSENEDEKTGSSTGYAVWGDSFINNNMALSVMKNPSGNLESITLSSTHSDDDSIFMFKKTQSDTYSITYEKDAANKVASSYNKLNDFANGNKIFLSLPQWKKSVEKMASNDQTGKYSFKKEKEWGLDLNASGSVQALLKVGVKLGIEGVYKYGFEEETGIYENGTVYIQGKNDIEDTIEEILYTPMDLVDDLEEKIKELLNNLWEGATKLLDDAKDAAVEIGKATVKKAKETGKNIVVSITKTIEKITSMSVLSVDDELSLFSTSYLSTTVGEPYIISAEDENGNQVNDLSDNPLVLTLSYTDEDLLEAGVTDVNDLRILLWSEEKNVYVNKGGVLDHENKCMTLEITKTGQYILAVDNCPPSVTEFSVRDEGSEPVIYANVTDMNDFNDFSLKINGTEVVNKENYEEFYNYSTAIFEYQIKDYQEGEYEGILTVTDLLGNTTEQSLIFNVHTETPDIEYVTELDSIINTKKEIEARVSGEDISRVFLNIKTADVYGNETLKTIEMEEYGEGIYKGITPDTPEGYSLTMWVSAYNKYGNSSESGTQSSLIVPGATDSEAVVITNIENGNVTVKCIGCEGVSSGKVYLGIYDSFDKLLETKIKPVSEEVTFSDVKDYGKLKAFIWQGANPVCENAEY